MNTSFDWTLVRSFLAALEHGSLLGAAKALRISQPTMGRHIEQLEAQWGVVLFERTGRGLQATQAATALAAAARTMEAGALELSRALTSATQQVRGSVRISASQSVACALLAPILQRLQTQLPQVQIELVVSNDISNLLRREADIALRMVQPLQSSLVAQRVGDATLGVYAHPAYLQRHGTPQSPHDLLHHRLIGQDRGEDLLRGFAAMGTPVSREHFAFRTDDFIAYWEAVRAGLGIGFVANHLAQTDPRICRVLPDMPLPHMPVWLTVHREIHASPRIRAVYDFLAQALPPALQAVC